MAFAQRLRMAGAAVQFVEFSAVDDPDSVLDRIASTIGVRESADTDVHAALIEHFRAQAMLIVLDNMEELVEAGPVVVDLVASAPNLSVLMTSRIPMNVGGE